MTAASGSLETVPSDSARVSSTPWKSGVNQAMTWSGSGRLLIGKNVPENRKSGVIPKRKIGVELRGRRLGRRERRDRRGEGEAGQHAGRDRQHDRGRRGRAEQRRSRS